MVNVPDLDTLCRIGYWDGVLVVKFPFEAKVFDLPGGRLGVFGRAGSGFLIVVAVTAAMMDLSSFWAENELTPIGCI